MTQPHAVFEGVTMRGYRTQRYQEGRTISGVVASQREWRKVGESIEPSGYSFAVLQWVYDYWFHPYSGSLPIRCRRPRHYITDPIVNTVRK